MSVGMLQLLVSPAISAHDDTLAIGDNLYLNNVHLLLYAFCHFALFSSIISAFCINMCCYAVIVLLAIFHMYYGLCWFPVREPMEIVEVVLVSNQMTFLLLYQWYHQALKHILIVYISV